jgi:hypothetical protein
MPPPDAEVARFAYLPDDFNAFGALAAGRLHSGVLSEATGSRLDRSIRYRELLRPNGITGELRIALVADGACWGTLSIFREAPGDFTTDERDFAHSLDSRRTATRYPARRSGPRDRRHSRSGSGADRVDLIRALQRRNRAHRASRMDNGSLWPATTGRLHVEDRVEITVSAPKRTETVT